MKIGILTFHRACNYGGALQCFALAKKLNTMGYNVEVVDYRSKAIEQSYQLINMRGLKSFLASILCLRKSMKKGRISALLVNLSCLQAILFTILLLKYLINTTFILLAAIKYGVNV